MISVRRVVLQLVCLGAAAFVLLSVVTGISKLLVVIGASAALMSLILVWLYWVQYYHRSTYDIYGPYLLRQLEDGFWHNYDSVLEAVGDADRLDYLLITLTRSNIIQRQGRMIRLTHNALPHLEKKLRPGS